MVLEVGDYGKAQPMVCGVKTTGFKALYHSLIWVNLLSGLVVNAV